MSTADGTYSPGDWVAVAGAGVWLLADLRPADPAVARCWPLIQHGATAEQILDALIADGLGAAVSFVLVHLGRGDVRIVVRGRGAVLCVWPDGSVVPMSAAVGTTWMDQVLAVAPSEIRLSATGAEAGVLELPLSAGVTMAAAIRVAPAGVPIAATPRPPAPWLTLPPLVDEPDVASMPPPAAQITASHDTVDRASLVDAATADLNGPTVLAVRCAHSHLNPPHASVCRVCGQEVPAQGPFHVARPVLGLLRLSTGDVVTLDRGVVLGRVPQALSETGRPHLVRLASPDNDISRVHLEVILDGWHVLLRDCNSTNGTTIALPGQPPVRLRPNDLQAIEPQTLVSLADEVSFRYEVIG